MVSSSSSPGATSGSQPGTELLVTSRRELISRHTCLVCDEPAGDRMPSLHGRHAVLRELAGPLPEVPLCRRCAAVHEQGLTGQRRRLWIVALTAPLALPLLLELLPPVPAWQGLALAAACLGTALLVAARVARYRRGRVRVTFEGGEDEEVRLRIPVLEPQVAGTEGADPYRTAAPRPRRRRAPVDGGSAGELTGFNAVAFNGTSGAAALSLLLGGATAFCRAWLHTHSSIELDNPSGSSQRVLLDGALLAEVPARSLQLVHVGHGRHQLEAGEGPAVDVELRRGQGYVFSVPGEACFRRGQALDGPRLRGRWFIASRQDLVSIGCDEVDRPRLRPSLYFPLPMPVAPPPPRRR